jgi:hypothetical protein
MALRSSALNRRVRSSNPFASLRHYWHQGWSMKSGGGLIRLSQLQIRFSLMVPLGCSPRITLSWGWLKWEM